MSHENMVRAYVDNGIDTTGGTNIYTPESGKVFDMKEVAIYHVANGKIAREEFFYG